LGCRSGTAAGVVEVDDGLRAAGERFGRADILHAVTFPQAAAVAEGLQAAFRADARTGEDDAFFHGLFLIDLPVGCRLCVRQLGSVRHLIYRIFASSEQPSYKSADMRVSGAGRVWPLRAGVMAATGNWRHAVYIRLEAV